MSANKIDLALAARRRAALRERLEKARPHKYSSRRRKADGTYEYDYPKEGGGQAHHAAPAPAQGGQGGGYPESDIPDYAKQSPRVYEHQIQVELRALADLENEHRADPHPSDEAYITKYTRSLGALLQHRSKFGSGPADASDLPPRAREIMQGASAPAKSAPPPAGPPVTGSKDFYPELATREQNMEIATWGRNHFEAQGATIGSTYGHGAQWIVSIPGQPQKLYGKADIVRLANQQGHAFSWDKSGDGGAKEQAKKKDLRDKLSGMNDEAAPLMRELHAEIARTGLQPKGFAELSNAVFRADQRTGHRTPNAAIKQSLSELESTIPALRRAIETLRAKPDKEQPAPKPKAPPSTAGHVADYARPAKKKPAAPAEDGRQMSMQLSLAQRIQRLAQVASGAQALLGRALRLALPVGGAAALRASEAATRGNSAGVIERASKSHARAATGQFATPGSAGHFAAHRRDYAQQKADGLISGDQADYKKHLNGWHEKKHAMLVELIKDLEHSKLEQSSLTGADLARCKRRCVRLAARIARLRKQLKQ